MKGKGKIIVVLIATVLTFALGMQTTFSQEKEESELDASKVMRKLDEVLANQEEAFKQFEEIKQELAIIKVRASRR